MNALKRIEDRKDTRCKRSTRFPDQILVNSVDKALIIYKPDTAMADSVMLRTIRFRVIK